MQDSLAKKRHLLQETILQLLQRSSLTLLLAPPAFGKTRLTVHLWQEDKQKQWLFVAPFRALANELAASLQSEGKIILFSQQADWESLIKKQDKASHSLMIITPELLLSALAQNYLSAHAEELMIIFDEFHLYFHWGESFRPAMWESFYFLASLEAPILALTGTMDLAHWQTMESWSHQFREVIKIDMGNRQLLHYPQSIQLFTSGVIGKWAWRKNWLMQLSRLKKDETFLYFCRTKAEVHFWFEWCTRRQLRVLSCVGGEVATFSRELFDWQKRGEFPQVIVSTIALSHGVNLPPISKIFLSYVIDEEDFWWQMIGRGGRRGENYQVYLRNTFDLSINKKSWRFYLKKFRQWVIWVVSWAIYESKNRRHYFIH